MNKCICAVSAAAVAVASAASADTFTNESDFLNAINGDYYHETFDGVSYGDPIDDPWVAPGANGYGWTATSLDGLGLWWNDNALSLNNATDSLVITFTGLDVTAFGGNFTAGDISGNPIVGTTTIELSNGDSFELDNQDLTSFFGWTGEEAIDSITISADAGAVNAWPALGNFYIGQAVPGPGAMALLGLAGLAGCRRRRA